MSVMDTYYSDDNRLGAMLRGSPDIEMRKALVKMAALDAAHRRVAFRSIETDFAMQQLGDNIYTEALKNAGLTQEQINNIQNSGSQSGIEEEKRKNKESEDREYLDDAMHATEEKQQIFYMKKKDGKFGYFKGCKNKEGGYNFEEITDTKEIERIKKDKKHFEVHGDSKHVITEDNAVKIMAQQEERRHRKLEPLKVKETDEVKMPPHNIATMPHKTEENGRF